MPSDFLPIQIPSPPRFRRGLLQRLLLTLFLALLGPLACASPAEDQATLKRQVTETEAAFAASMASRDFAAFSSFVADDAVFLSSEGALRGKAAVLAFWKRFYVDPKAPFSWAPRVVEVLDNGSLALSSGPVFDPAGKEFAGFTSVWRREKDGRWRIIFDKGNPKD